MRKLASDKLDEEDYKNIDKHLKNYYSKVLPNQQYNAVVQRDAVRSYDTQAIQKATMKNPIVNKTIYAGNYSDEINAAAKETGMDPHLLGIMMGKESNGNPRALSPKQAYGLMQITPIALKQVKQDTGKDFDLTDPAQNIMAGALLLKNYMKQFKGDIRQAVGAYNAGPHAVRTKDAINRYPETRDYVTTIMGKYDKHLKSL